jgi:hypothetical protein
MSLFRLMESFFFADKERGIYGSVTGAIYLCAPDSFSLRATPFVVAPPYRIVTHESLDPYFVVFTQSGHINIWDVRTCEWTLRAPWTSGSCK